MPTEKKYLPWIQIGLTILSMTVIVTVSHMGLVNKLNVVDAVNKVEHGHMKEQLTELKEAVKLHLAPAIALVKKDEDGQPTRTRQ